MTDLPKHVAHADLLAGLALMGISPEGLRGLRWERGDLVVTTMERDENGRYFTRGDELAVIETRVTIT